VITRSDIVTRITYAYEHAQKTAGGPRKTPFEYSPAFSAHSGARVYLKCEHQQFTGSFKFRGALNKILNLNSEQRMAGVIAASTGNHGMGVARAAQIQGVDAVIYVPATASTMKLAAIEHMGAEIVKVNGNCLDAELQARKDALAENKTFISPYNDVDVMAGQGTIAVEMTEQLEHLDALYIAVGGGGLIGGIGSYFKQYRKNTRIVGCWPEAAPAMLRCLEAGRVIDVLEENTLSDATAGGVEPGSITFPVCQDVIDDRVTVSEEEIAEAMLLMAEKENWMVEGSVGVALAACLKETPKYQNKNVAVLVCGRNIDTTKFLSVFANYPSSS